MKTIVPSPEQERAAKLLHALGNPLRMAMLHYIVDHPGCICNDLVLRFGRAQATISQHLGILRRARIVCTERDGHATCYSVNREVVGWLVEEIRLLYATNGGR